MRYLLKLLIAMVSIAIFISIILTITFGPAILLAEANYKVLAISWLISVVLIPISFVCVLIWDEE
jgi:uncharacterized membrane protein (DUF485 family)